MNRSWKNTSHNSSPGFVYFNTNKSIQTTSSQNSLDTSDFLSFGSDSSPARSPHGNHFSPSNYSSPRNHYYGKSPRQRGGRNQPFSPIKQAGGKFWRRNIGLTGPAERSVPSTNYQNFSEDQHSQNRNNQTHRQRKSFHHSAPNQSFNSSAFYDKTCLQDPWADLEQKLAEERKKEDDSLVKLNSSQSTSQSMDVAAEEASSDESESEDDSDEIEESFS